METIQNHAAEPAVDVQLNVTGHNGHTELSFTKDSVRVKWAETGVVERGLIKSLIQTSQLFGFKAFNVDADGKAADAVTKLPGIFQGKKGEVLLEGEPKKVKLLCEEMINGEIKDGKMVFEAQKDGTWKILREPGEFKADEKKSVTTSSKVGGG